MEPILRREIFPLVNWKDFLHEGKKEFDILFQVESNITKPGVRFQFFSSLGEGAFGKVLLARIVPSEKAHAVKILEKQSIVKAKQVERTFFEKRILQALNHPFTVHLDNFFQDNLRLFFVLPFVEGGDLFRHLRKEARFSEDLTRFYAAQVLLALEYLHHCGLVYRDLKPENILMDRSGYLKLTDFGFCKAVKGKTYSFCGTPEYMAPEVVLSKGHNRAADWWSFGVLLFEMSSGTSPFFSKDPLVVYELIISCTYTLPTFISTELTNLIANLLNVDITKRYGSLKRGIDDIKCHKWFKTINWVALFNGNIVPTYLPKIFSTLPSSSFHKSYELDFSSKVEGEHSKLFENF